MRTLAALILLLVVSSVFAIPVSAADISISVEKENIQTRMLLSVYQNVTAFPNKTAAITSADSDSFNAFSQAVKELNPSATLSDLAINVDSSKTWLNLSITMNLAGVSRRQGDVSTVNMSWKAFNVSPDLQTGNLSYNAIGKKYFRPVYEFYTNASKYVGTPNASITGISFFMNDTQVISGQEATDRMGNVTLLDFRSLSPALDQWARTYNLSNDTTTWRYTPTPILADYIKYQEGNNTKQLLARYRYSAEIIAPGLARANGDTLIVDVGSGITEWVMAGIVALALVSAIAVQMLFRNRKKKLTRMGRK